MIAVYSVGGDLRPVAERHRALDARRRGRTSWRATCTWAASPPRPGLFWKSVRMSTIVSVTSVVLAYPIAYLLALSPANGSTRCCSSSSCRSSRATCCGSWRGACPAQPAGGRQHVPVTRRGSSTSRSVALQQPVRDLRSCCPTCGCPFVALPIFVSLEGIDLNLLEASSDLGASRWRTFRTVTLPLSLPGVDRGLHLRVHPDDRRVHHAPARGRVPSGFMFGSAIQSAFTTGLDWQFGSAMAMFLVFAVAILLAIFGRYLNVRSVRGMNMAASRRGKAGAVGALLAAGRVPLRAAPDPDRLLVQRPRVRVVPVGGLHAPLVPRSSSANDEIL